MIQRLRFSTLLVLTLSATLSACDSERAHLRAVNAWHENRIERLTAPDGWLTVTGLYWLEPGPNSFGTADTNDIVFPDPDSTLSPYLGSFIVTGDSVRARVAADGNVHHTGTEAGTDTFGVLTDAFEDPTVFEAGTLTWFVIDREGRRGVRLQDSSSVARRTFSGIERYPVDPAWRIQGRYVPYERPKAMAVPTVLDRPATLTVPGAVEFDFQGDTYRLDVVGEPDAKRFWILFADPTNRSETYPAGRYVYIDAPPPSGSVEIDFNVSYNPPCAFTDFATCPFPPPQNRLKLPVEAGEKGYHLPKARS